MNIRKARIKNGAAHRRRGREFLTCRRLAGGGGGCGCGGVGGGAKLNSARRDRVGWWDRERRVDRASSIGRWWWSWGVGRGAKLNSDRRVRVGWWDRERRVDRASSMVDGREGTVRLTWTAESSIGR